MITSIEFSPPTHEITCLKNDRGYQYFRHTTTVVAIEEGYIDICLEALKKTQKFGENVEAFLGDDFKIMQANDYHLYGCDKDICGKHSDSSSKTKRYFGGPFYLYVSDEDVDESRGFTSHYRGIGLLEVLGDW